MKDVNDYSKNTPLDGFLAILFIFILPLALIIIGAFYDIMYLVSLPFMIYAIIGLKRKRFWVPKFYSRHPFFYKNKFFTGNMTKKIAIMYLVLGLISFTFFFALTVLVPMPNF